MMPLDSPPRIFLVANASKPTAVKICDDLSQWLESKGMLVGSDLDGQPESLNRAEPDFVIALGGDGTILRAGQAMQHRQVPIIGVNIGKLGYLADFDAREVRDTLDEILAHPGRVDRRMMLDIRIHPPAGDTWDGIALNDCVLRVGDPFRTVTLVVRIDDHPLCTLVGDGVILATPTGSTAHNMSCGGPIVEPGVEAIIVTPKCAHSFTHRPIVVSPSAHVCISLPPASRDDQTVAVVLDGQAVQHITPGTRIEIRKSQARFQLVRNPKRTPWDTLITKLKWGQDIT